MFVSEPAAQTCFFVAIVVFELHESLRISCRLDGDACCLPHAGDMVVFSPYLVEQRDPVKNNEMVKNISRQS